MLPRILIIAVRTSRCEQKSIWAEDRTSCIIIGFYRDRPCIITRFYPIDQIAAFWRVGRCSIGTVCRLNRIASWRVERCSAVTDCRLNRIA